MRLPIRQHVGGIERRVLVAAGGLAFDRDGEIVETSPARDEAVAAIAHHARRQRRRGADHRLRPCDEAAPGDTLQAVRGHGFAPVLARPGRAGPDRPRRFRGASRERRARPARRSRRWSPQGEWLSRLGIEARAAGAVARQSRARGGDRRRRSSALPARDQMGELFKVIAIHSPDWPAPAGFE